MVMDTENTRGLISPDLQKPREAVQMKLKITKGTAVNGEVLAIGDTVEVDDETGRLLVALKKAEEVKAKPKKGEKAEQDDNGAE